MSRRGTEGAASGWYFLSKALTGADTTIWREKKLTRATDIAFLEQTIVPQLKPCPNKKYATRFAWTLQSAVRSSYLWHDEKVYWAMEFQDPTGTLLPKSVLPLKLGRRITVLEFSLTPKSEPKVRYAHHYRLADEEAPEYPEDPMYNLIFDAWDAQIEGNVESWFPLLQQEAVDRVLAAVNALHPKSAGAKKKSTAIATGKPVALKKTPGARKSPNAKKQAPPKKAVAKKATTKPAAKAKKVKASSKAAKPKKAAAPTRKASTAKRGPSGRAGKAKAPTAATRRKTK